MTFILIVELLFGWICVKDLAFTNRSLQTIISFIFIYTLFCLSTSIVEEVFIRGYLLNILKDSFGIKKALIISSIIFGIMHLINPSAIGSLIYLAPLTLTFLGIMFGLGYLIKERIWIPIGLHFSWNFFGDYVYGLHNIAAKNSIFLVTNVTGPKLWVGIPNITFGQEVGLISFITMIIGIAILYFSNKKFIRLKKNVNERILIYLHP